MASIKTYPASKYWYATYRDADGKQRTKSLRIEHSPEPLATIDQENPTDPKILSRERERIRGLNKRAAQEAANRLEEAERGHPTEAKLRQIVSDISERILRHSIDFPTTAKYLREFYANRKLADNTRPRYENAVATFIASLGSKAQLPLDTITPADVNRFVQSRQKEGLTNSTINTDLKALNVGFSSALRQGLVKVNPIASADPVESNEESRKPFTQAEVEKLLSEAKGTDWETAILLAAFAGLRLGDAINLQWSNIKTFSKELHFRPRKTARKARDLELPICDRLMDHLLSLPGPENPTAYITPALAGKASAGKSGLSMKFARLMAKAGVDAESIHPEVEDGKGRTFNRKSFHSLRHFFIAHLEQKGVHPDVRMVLAGHTSERIHAKYSHIGMDSKRKAVEAL